MNTHTVLMRQVAEQLVMIGCNTIANGFAVVLQKPVRLIHRFHYPAGQYG